MSLFGLFRKKTPAPAPAPATPGKAPAPVPGSQAVVPPVRRDAPAAAFPPVTAGPSRAQAGAPNLAAAPVAGASVAPPTAAAPAPVPVGESVPVPVSVVLKLLPATALSAEGAHLLQNPGQTSATVPLPQDDVLRQLATGVVQFPFSMLQRLVPANLLQPAASLAAYADTPVRFPLGEVVRRVPPRLLAKRQGQATLGDEYRSLDAPFVPQRGQAPAAPIAPQARPVADTKADLSKIAPSPAEVTSTFAQANLPMTAAPAPVAPAVVPPPVEPPAPPVRAAAPAAPAAPAAGGPTLSRAQRLAERLRERESLLRSIRDDAPAAPVAPEPEPEPVRAPEPEPVAVAAPAPEPPVAAPVAPVAAAPAVFDPRRALGRWLGAPDSTNVGVKELPALVSANPAIRGCALVDDEGLALSSTLPAGVSEGSLGALATRIFQLLSQSAIEVGMEPRDQVLATFGEHTLLITRAKPFLIVTLHASPAVSASLQRRLQRIARALVAAETAG